MWQYISRRRWPVSAGITSTPWEAIFIHDSYACRKGKGVHKGVLCLQHFIREVTANGSRPAYYIQLDIKNYFMSIDKEILFSLLDRKIRDEAALWLTRALIFHDCTDNYVLRGEAGLMESIPPHKTLFHAPKNKGLPIGNLNSQFFANVYPVRNNAPLEFLTGST